jgi:hypothetical protein
VGAYFISNFFRFSNSATIFKILQGRSIFPKSRCRENAHTIRSSAAANLDEGHFQVRFEELLACPSFVEHEFSGIFWRDVQVVVDTTCFLVHNLSNLLCPASPFLGKSSKYIWYMQ